MWIIVADCGIIKWTTSTHIFTIITILFNGIIFKYKTKGSPSYKLSRVQDKTRSFAILWEFTVVSKYQLITINLRSKGKCTNHQ
jgi:hypothetical protein